MVADAMNKARGFFGRWKYLILTLGLLVYYNSGAEWMRIEKSRIKSAADLITADRSFVWPPWRALQLYVSHDSDEHLFFEISRLVLGETYDLRYFVKDEKGVSEQDRAALRQKLSARSGIHLPYRDFVVGYPPLGVLTMLVPRLFVSSLPAYRVAFGAFMSALYLVALWLGWRIAQRCFGPTSNQRWLKQGALLLFCIGPTLVMRYDILPVVLVAGALLCLVERRAILASICMLLGMAAKMYPLLILPTWMALLLGFGGAARRTAWRAGAFLALVACAALGAILVVSPEIHPLFADPWVFLARPLQIESIIGSVLVAVGGPAAIVESFGSFNVDTVWAGQLAPYWDAAMGMGLLVLALFAYFWAARRRQLSPQAQARAICAWSVAALLLLLATTKLLSAQYLIWSVPMIGLVRGERGRSVFYLGLLTLVLTQVIYPTLYGALVSGASWALAILLLRNALLVSLAVIAVQHAWHCENSSTRPSSTNVPRGTFAA